MSNSQTRLEPDSGAERFARHLLAHPDIEFSRVAVAKFLGITAESVDSALRPAVELALVTVAADGKFGRVWRAGPRLAQWPHASIPLSAQEPAAAGKRGGRTHMLPSLDLSTLSFASGRPMPFAGIESKGRTRHDPIFEKLKADGDSVCGIPRAYRAALSKAVQTYLNQRPGLKARSQYLVRIVDDQHCGVWRIARDKTAVIADPGRKPRDLEIA
jgi:hypothetical protein